MHDDAHDPADAPAPNEVARADGARADGGRTDADRTDGDRADRDGADDRGRFAADLRDLRLSAGSPTLAALGHTTGVSKTVLSEAFSGRRLPSARTVAAVVAAFDGDVRSWVRRRDAIDSAASGAAEGDQAAVGPAGVRHADPATPDQAPTASADARPGLPGDGETAAQPSPPGHPVVRRRTAVLLAAAAFVLGVGLAAAGTAAVRPVDAAPAAGRTDAASAVGAAPDGRGTVATGPAIIVPNGTDPADTACVEDAEVVASETRVHDTQLQIVWSASCHAAWARITRYDAQSHGNTVSASIYRQVAPHAKDRQSTTEPDAEGAYTPLLVRPTPSTRLCAEGSITVDGEAIGLGDPLCL